MNRLVLLVNSLSKGGAERQAAIHAACFDAMGLDVAVVSVLESAEYADDTVLGRTRFLGKRDRWSLPALVRDFRRLLRPDDLVMSYNWYPHLIAYLAGARVRIARYGNAPAADGVRGLRATLMRLAHHELGAVIGCSAGVLREAVTLGSPRVVCAGIPNALALPPPSQDCPFDQPYIVAAGRLHPLKDFGTLLRSYARSESRKSFALVLLGEGEERPLLLRLVRELGIEDRVHMPGHVDNIQDWLAHARVLALTSLREGFGNVIIEAMSLGTPVVATDAPYGPREIISQVPAGLLVPLGDDQAFAQALDAVACDDARRSDLSRVGSARAGITFGSERITRCYLDVIDAVRREMCR